MIDIRLQRYAFLTLAAAALFGASTPLAKLLLHDISPVTLGCSILGAEQVCSSCVRSETVSAQTGGKPSGLQAGDYRCLVGGLLLSYDPGAQFNLPLSSIAVIGACLMWATDNNLTRRTSASDSITIAMIKGLAAGAVTIALRQHSAVYRAGGCHPGAEGTLSLVFVGALLLMVLATWPVLAEQHEHEHEHDGTEGPERHTQAHVHLPLRHPHPHLPDIHRQHGQIFPSSQSSCRNGRLSPAGIDITHGARTRCIRHF